MESQKLFEQILSGRTDLVFECIEKGLSVSNQDEHGTYLIQWCAYYGDASAIKFLLKNGATLDQLGVNLDLNGAAFHGHW